MEKWSLERILESLHDDIHTQLEIAKRSLAHPGTKGDASEDVWIELFNNYLPKRYQAEKAHVVDSKGNFSQQIDVVIFDRQYSPFIFKFQNAVIIPAESVYGVFEAKQSLNADKVRYAQEKIKSVRNLFRTSLCIPHAGGIYPAKPPGHILGGILTFESDWEPGLGDALNNCLVENAGCLDIGCAAAHGYFSFDKERGEYQFFLGAKPATSFLFKLISELQVCGTVPMIDVLAYSQWLQKPSSTS